MPIVFLRFIRIAWQFRWAIGITLGIVAAKAFMPGEAMRQAWATVERFAWLITTCFALYAAAQFFNWRREIGSTKGERD